MTKTKIKAIEVYNNPTKGKYAKALYRKVEDMFDRNAYLISDGYSIIKLLENPEFEIYNGNIIGHIYRDFENHFILDIIVSSYEELNQYLKDCYNMRCNLKLYKRILKILGKDTRIEIHINSNSYDKLKFIIYFINIKGEEAYLLPEVII